MQTQHQRTNTDETPQSVKDAIQRTCLKCGHAQVCSVLVALTKFFTQPEWEKNLPFQPQELAMICKRFFPQSLVVSLTEAEQP